MTPPIGPRVHKLADDELRPASRRAYERAADRFLAWCEATGRDPYEHQAVTDYLEHRFATAKGPSALHQDMTSVRRLWRAAGLDSPTDDEIVKRTLAGATRRSSRENPPSQAPALRLDDLRELARELERQDTPTGARDRAMVLIGFFGALRRSELVALDLDDVAGDPRGLLVTIRASKTSDHPAQVAIPTGHGHTDPVAAWTEYLHVRGRHPGPAFVRASAGGSWWTRPLDPKMRRLGERALERSLRAALERAGVADAARYSAHSLRAGVAVELAQAGVSLAAIMEHGRWKSAQVATGYARRGRLWEDCALNSLSRAKIY